MPTNPPTDPAAQRPSYMDLLAIAGFIAVVVYFIGGPADALAAGAAVVLIGVAPQLGRDAMARRFRSRSDLPDRDPNGHPIYWSDPARDAWIRLASPAAGVIASSASGA